MLALALALITALSAAIVLPAAAAENETACEAVTDPTETVEGEVYGDIELGDSFTEKVDLAATGTDAVGASEKSETSAPAKATTSAGTSDAEKKTVGAITSVKRTTKASDYIGLKWNSVSGADGYHVYWRNVDLNKEFVLGSTVKETKLTIKNLQPGSAYKIKVAAYIKKDGKSVEGKSKTVKVATIPVKVENFRIAKATVKATTLKWSKVSRSDGYILYRKVDGVWSRYKVLGRNKTEFTDKELTAGKAYFYNICAYREDVSGTLKGKTTRLETVAGLTAPSNNGTKILLRKVYLNWTKVKYANGYDIYYSTNNKDYKLLTTTTATSFITHRLKDDRIYYFRVYPYRIVGDTKTKVHGTFYGKKYQVYNSAYGKKVPSTYVEVSLEKQHMWYYINDELYVSTPVVTGNYGSMGTPRGYWKVNSKASPCTLSGPGYATTVTYWMAFIGSGWGIHDASWRSSFGGQIYKGNGSHGCINTPYKAVQKMYRKMKVGTPVIVY